jgi:hypothetical protein
MSRGLKSVVVWGLVGYAAGSLLTGGIALVGVILSYEEPPPRHGPDPIGGIFVLVDLGVRGLVVLAWSFTGGVIGAVVGAVWGAVRTWRRGAPATPAPEEEIAALRARIEELERSRGGEA